MKYNNPLWKKIKTEKNYFKSKEESLKISTGCKISDAMRLSLWQTQEIISAILITGMRFTALERKRIITKNGRLTKRIRG